MGNGSPRQLSEQNKGNFGVILVRVSTTVYYTSSMSAQQPGRGSCYATPVRITAL